jgi:hypothetical protein
MKIASQERETLRWAWLLAILFNVIYGFIIFLLLWLGITHLNPSNLAILLFVFLAMGGGLLVWALRETLLWKAYGETFFLSDVDIFPWGGRLLGRISFSHTPASMNRHLRLSLFCVVESTPGGNQGSQTVWSDSQSVDIAPDGTIPILFSLPAEVNRNPAILYYCTIWKLKVKEVGGGFRSFAADYILPVEEAPEKDPFEHESKRKRGRGERRS